MTVLSPTLREMVYIHTTRLKHSNTPDKIKIDTIAKDFNWDQFGLLPVYPVKDKYLLTDGNHRLEAAKARGFEWIPCLILNKAEFDHIKYSKKTAEIYFKIPENPKYIK